MTKIPLEAVSDKTLTKIAKDFLEASKNENRSAIRLASEKAIRLILYELRDIETRCQVYETEANLISLENIENHIQNLREFYKKILNREKKSPKLIISNLVDEIAQVAKDYPNSFYRTDTGQVFITIRDIIIGDVDLGDFNVEIEGDNKIYCSPVTTEYINGEGNPHPHVSTNNRLCTGAGTEAISQALIEGRLTDLYTLIESILNTYCPNDAYAPIESWTGFPCQACGEIIAPGEELYCTWCEEQFHEVCLYQCKECGSHICTDCEETCSKCEATLCPNCLVDHNCENLEEGENNDEKTETVENWKRLESQNSKIFGAERESPGWSD